MRTAKSAWLLLILFSWCQNGVFTEAADKRQVQAIWEFRGPCYPVPNAQMIDVITHVVNPLIAVPWGTQTQSEGFGSLCSKAGIQGCNSESNLVLTPATPASAAAASQAPAPAGPSASGNKEQAAPAPASSPEVEAAAPVPASSARRLLQGEGSCSGKPWFLYLDTTEPDTLPNGAWNSEVIIYRVKAAMADGQFQQLLSKTSLAATQATLRYIGINYVKENTTPTSASGGSGGSGSGGGGEKNGGGNGGAGASPGEDGNYQFNWGSSSSVPGQGGSVSSSSGAGGGSSSEGGSTGSKAGIIAGVIGGVVGAAILAALVGALILRRRNLQKARAKVNADLAAHRKGRQAASRFKYSSSAGSRSYSRHTFDKPSPTFVPSPSGTFVPPKSSISGKASPRKAAPTWAERATGAHAVTAHAELEMQDEFHTVLDAAMERSAAPEVSSQERKPRFLGIFASKA